MVVRTALVMVALGVALSACSVRFVEHEFQDDHTVGDKIASVRFQSGSGNVAVRYREDLTETKIHRIVEHHRDAKPSGVSHRMEGDTLVLDDCGNNCVVNYEVTVPSKEVRIQGDVGSGDVTVEGLASVQVHSGSGNFTFRDVAGAVRVDSGSGDLRAERIGGDITAKFGSGNVDLVDVKGKTTIETGSGEIRGSGLDGDVTADANSGNVDLRLAAQRSVRVETGSGDITVRVPGGPYKLNSDSGSGDRRVDVATDPTASSEINLRAGSGSITVLPA